MQYLDIAKGIAIILVVLGHSAQYIVDNPSLMSLGTPAVSQLHILFKVIYGFHIPLFFFIAGMFADKSLRYPAGVFLKKRLTRYALPYFAWVLIVISIKLLAPDLQNTPAGFRDLLLCAVVPYTQYWFLYVLFFVSIAYYFTMKAGKSRNMKSALFAVSVALRVLAPFVPQIWIIPLFSKFALYFMLGSYFDCAKLPEKLVAKRFIPLLLASGFVFFNGVYIASGLYQRSDFIQSWYSIALAFIGIAATIGLAYGLSMADTALTRTLTFCGVNSMQIYCSHGLPLGALRVVLYRLIGTRYLLTRTLLHSFATVALCCTVFRFWPNDPYLHLILFGEPHVKNGKKGGSTS